ncbi:transmembrane protein, putative (macronuclear) [Tetrahymena thermophila SB210]|uniref:Transmembrane protein, putative n=1 Tax=Tetrahymena thermophila (strain SB210) TaxID=312017 RepID=W7XAL9_TETTS|nr:transmembrane protein, putative [Tetrahymena thermophila SB210]EWS74382.1 transmembrane protein, putative [Tetrahymena thermophila SB210]|eukprot:XP_012653059.1 transmembrane protein, putative [Tetrahymena thermophila SB210]
MSQLVEVSQLIYLFIIYLYKNYFSLVRLQLLLHQYHHLAYQQGLIIFYSDRYLFLSFIQNETQCVSIEESSIQRFLVRVEGELYRVCILQPLFLTCIFFFLLQNFLISSLFFS